MITADSDNAVRVLLYTVNGMGLGHVTRLLAVARWLRILLNGLNLQARIFFLSCSDADAVIGAQGFPSFKLPSKTTLRAANLSDKQAVEVIRGVAGATLDELDPDILVIDTFPTGSYDELLPMLGRDRVTKVFVFREQRSDWAARIPYERLLSSFQLLLIPHPEGFFELPFVPPSTLRVGWAGDIIFGERGDLWTKAKVRRSLGLSANKTVIYTAAGGGGDPDSERTLATIIKTAQEVPGVHLVVGAGPLNRGTGRTGRNLYWTNYFPISRLFRGFDFAISSSGYNTVHEVLHFGLPAILYPQLRGADDQLGRARWVEGEGAGVRLEKLTPARLRKALARMQDRDFRKEVSRRAKALVPTNGARRAAEIILETALARRKSPIEVSFSGESSAE